MKRLTFGHRRLRLLSKALVALQENIDIQGQEKLRLMLALQLRERNCQRSGFHQLRIACADQRTARSNRKKAREFLAAKLLRISWNHWQIFRVNEVTRRLNSNLAEEFRQEVLMRSLFNNLLISNRIFKQVYSEDRMVQIYTNNRSRLCFNQLSYNCQLKQLIVERLPKQLCFYYYAGVWAEPYSLTQYSSSKYAKLTSNFQEKVSHHHMVKVFYTLLENYGAVKAFKTRIKLKS